MKKEAEDNLSLTVYIKGQVTSGKAVIHLPYSLVYIDG